MSLAPSTHDLVRPLECLLVCRIELVAILGERVLEVVCVRLKTILRCNTLGFRLVLRLVLLGIRDHGFNFLL